MLYGGGRPWSSGSRVLRRLVMHFTHIENLPGILTAGCLQAGQSRRPLVGAAGRGRRPGREGAQESSATCRWPRSAGWRTMFRSTFAPRSPMLLTLARGNVPTYSGGQDPLVYLVSSAEADRGRRADVPVQRRELRVASHAVLRRPRAPRLRGRLGAHDSADVGEYPGRPGPDAATHGGVPRSPVRPGRLRQPDRGPP